MKINYLKRSGANGTSYTQTIKIPLKLYEDLQDKIITERVLKFPRKEEYIQNSHDTIYLKELNNHFDYLNLTTLRFICLFLKDKRLKPNRNTIIEVEQ